MTYSGHVTLACLLEFIGYVSFRDLWLSEI